MSNKAPKNKILTNRPPYYLKSYAASSLRLPLGLLVGMSVMIGDCNWLADRRYPAPMSINGTNLVRQLF